MDQTQVSNIGNYGHAHLLELPRELRDAIYQFALPDPPVFLVYKDHPPWLLSCRQIFAEAAPIVYDQCCLYHVTDDEDAEELLNKLVAGYVTSFRGTSTIDQNSTYELIKPMVSYIAIDAHIPMHAEHLELFFEAFFARISELPNLKALYISLNVEAGVTRNTLKQHLARSDLRIFELVKFIKPVKLLLERLPKGCKIHWAIPESIRWAANGQTFEYSECNLPYMTQFMKEVQDAVVATERPEGEDNVGNLTDLTAGMSLPGSDGVTQ